jgi:hypothetical protein
MAIWTTDFDWPGFNAWLADRPQSIQDLAARFPPDRLFRIATTGKRGYVYSYSEDGTMTLAVTGQFNRVLFGQRVFGLTPEDLTECDLPETGEVLGDIAQEAGYTDEDIRTILIPRLMTERNES